MPSISTAHLKTRPQRIVFLVDPNASNALDTILQIISFSNKRWGGGYYPILPTDGKKIDGYWWNLLTHYDPDVIATTLDLDASLVSQIYRESVPCKIVKSHEGNLSNLNPLNCLHIPAFLSQVKPYSWNFQPVYLASPPSKQKRQYDVFFNVNFGLIEQTVSTDLLLNHSSINKMIIDETVHPNNFLIDAFGYNPTKPLFPKDVAKFWSNPPFSVKHDHLARAFHLIIGDTAKDLIWAWNRTLTSSGYNGRDFLWIPKNHFDTLDFYDVLNEWISKVYWDNTGSQAKGCIISSSLTNNELQEIKSKLQERKSAIRWSIFDNPEQLYKQFEFEDYWKIATTHTPIEHVGLEVSLDCNFRSQNYCSSARLTPSLPPFIINQDCSGEVMVDLELDYYSKNSSFQFRVPKRYGISQHLVVRNSSRPLNNGKVSIQMSASEASFTIREPSTQTMLASFGYQIPEKIKKEADFSSPKYSFEISSAGSSLLRLLEIFGSLSLAGEFFSDPIWTLIGLRFCNLQTTDFRDEKELATFSKNIYNAASSISEMNTISQESFALFAQNLHPTLNHRATTEKYLSYSEIANIFNEFRGKMIKKSDLRTNWKDMSFDFHYLPYLEELIRRGVFRMGSQLCCSHCGHKSWILLDDLRHKSNCVACASAIAIPLRPNLTFRLNDIIKDAIKDNSLPYVIRELHEQGRFPNSMFDFLPSQNVFCEGIKGPYTDLDIVVFRGSDLVIGEVKSEPTLFKPEQMLNLLTFAKEIRPQEVIMITQEGPIDEKISDLLMKIKAELESVNIKFNFKQLKRLNNWIDTKLPSKDPVH